MALPEFDTFREFYDDPDVQSVVADIRQCLNCTAWQAMVVFMLLNNQTVEIRPPNPDEDDEWK